MNETESDRLIRSLAPELHIPSHASSSGGPAAEDLMRRVMAVPAPRRRWRFAVAVPLAAGLATAVVAAVVTLPSSSPNGPPAGTSDIAISPSMGASPSAGRSAPTMVKAALQINKDDKYFEVRILDPVADPERYRAELAARGLNIEITLAPVEASEVGKVIFTEDDGTPGITPIESPGHCNANGACQVGIRVKLSYKGHARIVFGRTALPGETGEGDAPILTEEQKDQVAALDGKRVSEVRELLTRRGQTATYRVGRKSLDTPANEVPGSWYVYDATALSPTVIVLWVSSDGEKP